MKNQKKQLEGLGDVVSIAAKPIAKVSDKILGTNLANCKACEERRKRLNKRFPFKQRPNQ